MIVGIGAPVLGYAIPGPFSLNAYYSGVPINLAWNNPQYVGTPFLITGNIASSGMGVPTNLAGASMHFIIDGNNQGYVVSDSNGNFKFAWNSPTVGNHTLAVSWAGNSNYPQGGSITTSFIVYSAVTPPVGTLPSSNFTNPPICPTCVQPISGSTISNTSTGFLNWLTILGAAMFGYGWWKK